VVFVAVIPVIMDAAFSDAGSGLLSSLTFLMMAMWLMVIALAFPADALLVALSVLATQQAVSGRPVQMKTVFTEARKRMWAVCRITLVFYGISLAPDLVVIALFSATGFAVYASGLANAVLLVGSAVVFVFWVLLSLSPIIMLVERHGVIESLRRSVSLARPAWGRLIGIHLLWAVCIIPLVLVTISLGFNLLLFAPLGGCLLACFRVLQMLIYTDLRIRQEGYEHELIDE